MIKILIDMLQVRAQLAALIMVLVVIPNGPTHGQETYMLIDDFSDATLTSKLGTQWRGVSDQVMGGISNVTVTRGSEVDRHFLRLSGDVRLENNGGFIQAAVDLTPTREYFDASGYSGIRLVVRGNGEQYSVHLRTPDNIRPWQSYRAQFIAGETLNIVDIPFSDFSAYRTEVPIDISKLLRIGIVAIGRAFQADLSIYEVGFYR